MMGKNNSKDLKDFFTVINVKNDLSQLFLLPDEKCKI